MRLEQVDPQKKFLGAGCWVLGAGCWSPVAGCWVLVAGCWCYAEPGDGFVDDLRCRALVHQAAGGSAAHPHACDVEAAVQHELLIECSPESSQKTRRPQKSQRLVPFVSFAFSSRRSERREQRRGGLTFASEPCGRMQHVSIHRRGVVDLSRLLQGDAEVEPRLDEIGRRSDGALQPRDSFGGPV